MDAPLLGHFNFIIRHFSVLLLIRVILRAVIAPLCDGALANVQHLGFVPVDLSAHRAPHRVPEKLVVAFIVQTALAIQVWASISLVKSQLSISSHMHIAGM